MLFPVCFQDRKVLNTPWCTPSHSTACNNGGGREIQASSHSPGGTCPGPDLHTSPIANQPLSQQGLRRPWSHLLQSWLTDCISQKEPGPPLRAALPPALSPTFHPAAPPNGSWSSPGWDPGQVLSPPPAWPFGDGPQHPAPSPLCSSAALAAP